MRYNASSITKSGWKECRWWKKIRKKRMYFRPCDQVGMRQALRASETVGSVRVGGRNQVASSLTSESISVSVVVLISTEISIGAGFWQHQRLVKKHVTLRG
jgi:hypothetical protein